MQSTTSAPFDSLQAIVAFVQLIVSSFAFFHAASASSVAHEQVVQLLGSGTQTLVPPGPRLAE
jgi:hypothetical protein